MATGSGRNLSKSIKENDSSQRDTSPSNSKFVVSKEELRNRLSPVQYSVTQLKSTEAPNSGIYNKFNKKGIYHCIVCDQDLFESNTKYESGCGWPAFHGAIDKNRLKFAQDTTPIASGNLLLLAKNANLVRTEVLCGNCDAHLGHRFDDGPKSKGGKRYCVNSASLRFQPADDI